MLVRRAEAQSADGDVVGLTWWASLCSVHVSSNRMNLYVYYTKQNNPQRESLYLPFKS